MDTRLKERLVGAVVLVLAAVIFIPVVLDGPDSNARVSHDVALPEPARADNRRTVRIDLDDSVDEGQQEFVAFREPASIDLTATQQSTSVPAAGALPATETESIDSGSVPAQPADRTAAAARQSPSPAVAPWTVQVGSFSQDSNAETLAAELRRLGYPAYVSRFDDGNQVHHRVRVGSFPSRDAAQAEADEIHARTRQPARPARNH